jgi:hypothetical protein
MIAYESFRSLGLKVEIRPVLESTSNSYDSDETSEDETYYHIGHKFTQPVDTCVEVEECEGIGCVYEAYTKDVRAVTWMNVPKDQTKSVQLAYLAVSLSPEFGSLLADEILG